MKKLVTSLWRLRRQRLSRAKRRISRNQMIGEEILRCCTPQDSLWRLRSQRLTKKPGELSFTIFETIVAVGLLMVFTLEMAGGQGSVVSKVEYARRSNDAVWLAKQIMAQVEYNYQSRDLKDLDLISPLKDQTFKIDGVTDFEYTYTIDVREWKFPLFDFLLNGGGSKKDDEEKGDDNSDEANKPGAGGIPGMETIIEQIFNGHVLKIAHVDVSWAEGVRRESVGLTYLLTNSRALDEYLLSKKAVWEAVLKKMTGLNEPPPPPPPPPPP